MKLCPINNRSPYSYSFLPRYINQINSSAIIFIALLLFSIASFSQSKSLDSKVYTWDSATITNKKFATRTLFEGANLLLTKHSIYNNQLNRGISISYKKIANVERLIMVQSGVLTVNLKGVTKDLVKGSVVFLLAEDEMEIANNSTAGAAFYVMQYQSKTASSNPNKKLSSSFILDWKDIVFKAHDKGGVRQYFDIQSPLLNRFDIHVTTLNPGFKSHDPHTHKNEEIILMLDGNGEMQIGDSHQKSNAGDAVFLNSMVLHNITNVGTVPCLYFAIQWN